MAHVVKSDGLRCKSTGSHGAAGGMQVRAAGFTPHGWQLVRRIHCIDAASRLDYTASRPERMRGYATAP